MTTVKANFRGVFQHPDIIVSMPSGPDFGAQAVLAYFEDAVRQGTVFHAGETVQMGWLMLNLRATNDGDLEVLEPRFGEIPIVWECGASKTYRQLVVQESVAELFDVEPLFPSLAQSAVISPDFMMSTNTQMFRDPPSGTDSGWLFTTAENESDDGRLVSLFEIASKRPEVIPFLALPSESSVSINGKFIHVNCADKVIDSDSNELLRRLLASDLIS
ncbi:hypothetical protein [Paraburkholderia sp. C35]|uniref:immunity protein Imm33 domain-containing protein n=1 Tax=Paraburkholderia sp. C35 TaxID=2126993 RepID=UPI000D69102E|nr:hypothetical protein [Paraburkholderia sp. C35]